jgi:hypothetical protein
MAFREIENLMPIKEYADKTRMFRFLLKGQALSYFEHHLMRRLEAEDSEVPEWCHYCDKKNHNTADCRAIDKLKQQKKNKACFEAKDGPGKKSLAFLFKEINALKRQLKPKKTASSKKRKAESISLLKLT